MVSKAQTVTAPLEIDLWKKGVGFGSLSQGLWEWRRGEQEIFLNTCCSVLEVTYLMYPAVSSLISSSYLCVPEIQYGLIDSWQLGVLGEWTLSGRLANLSWVWSYYSGNNY